MEAAPLGVMFARAWLSPFKEGATEASDAGAGKPVEVTRGAFPKAREHDRPEVPTIEVHGGLAAVPEMRKALTALVTTSKATALDDTVLAERAV